MHCCGQDRTTPFCPDCGEPVAANPLVTLLRHVRSHVESQATRIASEEAASEANLHGNGDWHQRNADRVRKAQGKWCVWAVELEKAIARLKEIDDAK